MRTNCELQLLRGLPVSLDGVCKVYPLKLDDIAIMGHEELNKMLNYLLFDNKNIQLDENTSITMFDYWVYISDKTDDGLEFVRFLEAITKEKVTPCQDENGSFFYFGDLQERRFLTSDNLSEFQRIIKKQNFLEREEKKESRPASEAVRQLQEKFNRIKSQLSKKNNEDGLDLSDLISIVSAHSPNLDILNIWNLTVYQLHHLYIRLIMKDVYETEFQKWLQGEDPKKLKLDHWATKIKNKI